MASHEGNVKKDNPSDWRYQLRLHITDEYAEALRNDSRLDVLKPLREILNSHEATVVCQYDAFADFCARSERNGDQDLPLYKWTLATIRNPDKKAKYTKIFTIYVRGEEVYGQSSAEALEQELQPLVGGSVIEDLAKYDSNPTNNPQVPKKYRN